MTLQAGSSRQAPDAMQRVLVLNGGRATLRLAQGLQVDDTEVWWTPWGPGAAVRSQWVELVNGMEVQPRWPGGDAPVTLEIAAQSAGRADGPTRGAAAAAAWHACSPRCRCRWANGSRWRSCRAGSPRHRCPAAVSAPRPRRAQRSLQVRVSLP